MRLINTSTLELHEFFHSARTADFPTYAVLSHCWTSDEVSYKDFVKKRKTDSCGHQKILQCCAFALSRGLEWVWVDTCCIDKTSSSELSEAINSMFNWYRLARECYAHLADVPIFQEDIFSSFKRSRWFTRGWTLQELIAPRRVIFLTSDWQIIGYKSAHGIGKSQERTGFALAETDRMRIPRFEPSLEGDHPSTQSLELLSSNDATAGDSEGLALDDSEMVSELSRITNIPAIALVHPKNGMSSFSVATKFSWMARRSTTRVEDEAYCLLGIFGLNMPLLYGEGARAFMRLQIEIMRASNDESILSWHSDRHHLLAPDPSFFRFREPASQVRLFSRLPYSITNQGLRFEIQSASGAYVPTVYDPEAPDWIIIRLNTAISPEDFPALGFMYLKKLRCGHYVRRRLRLETIEMALSADQILQYVEGREDGSSSTSLHSLDADIPTLDNPTVWRDQFAAEMFDPLVIYIHLEHSQICKIPGNGGSADFASCLEEQYVRQRRKDDEDAEIQTWMRTIPDPWTNGGKTSDDGETVSLPDECSLALDPADETPATHAGLEEGGAYSSLH